MVLASRIVQPLSSPLLDLPGFFGSSLRSLNHGLYSAQPLLSLPVSYTKTGESLRFIYFQSYAGQYQGFFGLMRVLSNSAPQMAVYQPCFTLDVS